MQNIFYEVNTLDRICYEKYALSEDILMENAALGIKKEIETHFTPNASVLVVCGSGNNGADGITLARQLDKDYDVRLFLASEPKSDMAILQRKRAEAIGVKTTDSLEDADIVVDAIFGSGLKGEIDQKYLQIIDTLNTLKGYKIACDIPSGIDSSGNITHSAFTADATITMGALKWALFSDDAKDYCGEIKVADLGLSRHLYEQDSDIKLLDFSDMKLPERKKQNTHKGIFGHSAIYCGEKKGAALIAALSAQAFGSGLTTVIGSPEHVPYEIMTDSGIPKNTTAIAVGMGLGSKTYAPDIIGYPLVIDADMFRKGGIDEILKTGKSIVLTPHPKEFTELLKQTGFDETDAETVQKNRLGLAKAFSERFPHAVLLLKGANTIITHANTAYINPHGSAKLSKGGSGDVLSGLICALLAQGYAPLDAAITGSLALAKAAMNSKLSSYALSPMELIEQIKKL